MLWAMIRKEWVRNLLELRFMVCALLCVFLGMVSVVVLRADLIAKRADYTTNRQIYRKQAEEYGSYRDLDRMGIRVDRPPQNFQVLFYGMEKTLDRTAEISRNFLPGFAGNLNVNPMVLMFPVADLLFVVGVVLSLLAFFISYDAVAGEREEGTLKLLMSYAVPRDTVILAKWIGGYLSLALPFLVALVLSALLISLSSDIPFGAQDWEAFAVSGVVSLMLIAVMFSIGMLVSVRARRPATAILSLLALWVLLALVLPNVGPYLAEIVAPVPDVGAVERSIAERTKGLNDQFMAKWRPMMGRGGPGPRRDETPAQRQERRQQMTAARDELQAEINKATEEVIRDFERQLRLQVDVARNLTRLSPVAAYVYANTDIGETGVRHEQQLVDELRMYQRQFARYVEEKNASNGGGGMFWGDANQENYSIDDMPVFSYRAEGLEGRLAARTVDMALLAVFGVAFFMAAFVSFLRTDIT
jgi:ABC-type transport system involved in multi-copper enzyme maturation permease subunit